MNCLFCPIKSCPDAGVVDGPGCCDIFPAEADIEENWREEEDWLEEEDMLIERGISLRCDNPLHSD